MSLATRFSRHSVRYQGQSRHFPARGLRPYSATRRRSASFSRWSALRPQHGSSDPPNGRVLAWSALSPAAKTLEGLQMMNTDSLMRSRLPCGRTWRPCAVREVY